MGGSARGESAGGNCPGVKCPRTVRLGFIEQYIILSDLNCCTDI